MLFNSLEFGAFFILTLGLFSILPRGRRPLFLLLASYFFYGWWDARFLGLILLSTSVDFLMAKGMADATPKGKRLRLWTSIGVNLSILATFKYLGWFSAELGALFTILGLGVSLPVIKLILPVGLSFYTFQSMAYTIDVYRGDIEPCKKPLDFALFVAFFPQLVAGPIERSGRLIPQLKDLKGSTQSQRAQGAQLMLWGYFKKVFVADNLAVVVAQAFEINPNPSGAQLLLSAYAFSWQIYCDFSGYTDIARGVAKFLGVELSINFRLPFFADGPQDLWRRWHISLSQWLRDYLYIPLGGNRGAPLRTQFNLLATMILGGLWHGANWTFILWGALHGLALALQRALPRPLPLPKALKVLLTFHFTTFAFLIFRARDIHQAFDLIKAPFQNPFWSPGDGASLVQLAVLIAIPLALELAQYLRGDDLDFVIRWPRPLQAAFAIILLAAILLLGGTYGQHFIYFQF